MRDCFGDGSVTICSEKDNLLVVLLFELVGNKPLPTNNNLSFDSPPPPTKTPNLMPWCWCKSSHSHLFLLEFLINGIVFVLKLLLLVIPNEN